MERGPNYFTMDNLDGSKKESTVLANEGFDDQETSHTPVSRNESEIQSKIVYDCRITFYELSTKNKGRD